MDSLGFLDYEAVNVWGQVFATTATSSYDARLQVRDPRVWFTDGSAWAEASVVAGSMAGAYYPGDFQSGSTSGTARQDAPGVWSMPLGPLDGEPDALHFWWDGMFPRIVIPAGTQGILARQEMRLTGDPEFIASTGVDLFATPQTVVDPKGWNDGIPNPRMKTVTQEWQAFYVTTVSLATLTSTPPPTV